MSSFSPISGHIFAKLRKIIAIFAKNSNEMIVERETAGFVLQFAVGIMAATLTATHLAITQAHCTIPLCMTAAGLVCLIHPAHKKWNRLKLRAFIMAISLCCGLWIGFTHKTLSINSLTIHWGIAEYAEAFRISLQGCIDSIPFKEQQTAEIIKALITGEKAGLGPETTEAFRSSGAAHILALSGLHLGIIYAIISRVLSIMGNSPRIRLLRSILIITSCGFYTLSTGAGASIVRAFLFVVIGESILISGRKRNLIDILFASLFFHLVIWPESATDIGFQLSYAAMAGIAFIYPKLKRFLREYRVPKPVRWIWNSAAMSISCQLTTGPLAYHYFGTFPEYFLLTNLIALPLASLIIPTALLTLILHTFSICPALLVRLTESLITAMTGCLEIISQL